jgi:amino acid adenylation domain-containing protein
MAHYLRSSGVDRETLVALSLERSIDAVVTILAILKAGGAYAPLDPAYPEQRLQYMLDDMASPLLITHSDINPELENGNCIRVNIDGIAAELAAQPDTNPDRCGDGASLAYAIYTSGSTGLPKGTLIEHHSVLRLVINNHFAPLDERLRIGMLAPISFDASTLEIWGSLLNGGQCVVFPDRIPAIDKLREFFAAHPVDLLWLTSTLFNSIIDTEPGILQGVSIIMTGGEALSPAHIARAASLLPATRLINGYGPTESTTFTTTFAIPQPPPDWRSVPIGKPIANTTIYILDELRNPVPIGVAGELYIGGDGLSRGYLNQPELTDEKFVHDPFRRHRGARLYRTGDLVRYLADGNVEFLHRIDDQIKLRGFRIELGEIENWIINHDSVETARVILREDTPGDKLLAAYVVPATGAIDAAALRSHCQENLPNYMIPQAFVEIDEIPFTPNGKLDRAALPLPEAGAAATGDYVAPTTEIEAALGQIWEQLLNRDKIGIHDDFFALGGHSLLTIKLIAEIEKASGKQLSIADVFEQPTIAELANLFPAETKFAIDISTARKRGGILRRGLTALAGWFGRKAS